jgi:hypothetical protein
VKTTHDPELEQFKCTIDLVDYAKKAGYDPRPFDVGTGLTLLDHPNGDRMIVARTRSGEWIYAGARDYTPRRPGESPGDALARLRLHVRRTTDQGTIVEFAQSRQRTSYWTELPLERVRERLREFQRPVPALDLERVQRPPAHATHRERSLAPVQGGHQADGQPLSGEEAARRVNSELNRRRYDWTPPPPNGPKETQVDERLRRWREAQASIDLKVRGPREAAAPARSPAAVPPPGRDAKGPSLPDRPPIDRNESLGQKKNAELNRRRYDWTPAPAGVDALVREPRNRSPDRGR